MRKLLLMLLLLPLFVQRAHALEILPPEVPAAAEEAMPAETDNFGNGLQELLKKGLQSLRPDLAEASKVSISLVAMVIFVSVLQSFPGSVNRTANIALVTGISLLLLQNSRIMVGLATDTVSQISSYGKLLLPVMTSAMAAQGQLTASAAMYAGSAFFNALMTGVIAECLVPMVYVYLALAVGSHATGEEYLKKLSDLVKGLMGWVLKLLLMVFTTYISITGVVSGTTDAVALKATKVTISTVVPVVGGILSDASEAVLVSAGLMKNAAGIYGILAVLALLLDPFLRIGSHYLILKLTAVFCGIFGTKQSSGIIGDFSSAMGLLLGMTGASCLMVLISTVCFLRGVG